MVLQQVISLAWRSFSYHGQRQRAVDLTEERVRILSEAGAGEEVLAHARKDRALALESSRQAETAV